MWRIGMLFFFSDMLFPVWLILIMVVLIENGFKAWKAWAIAAGVVLAQGYIITKTIGFNLSFYAIVYVGFIPSSVLTLFGAPPDNVFSKDAYIMWVFPISIILILPTIILYLLSKLKRKDRNEGMSE